MTLGAGVLGKAPQYLLLYLLAWGEALDELHELSFDLLRRRKRLIARARRASGRADVARSTRRAARPALHVPVATSAPGESAQHVALRWPPRFAGPRAFASYLLHTIEQLLGHDHQVVTLEDLVADALFYERGSKGLVLRGEPTAQLGAPPVYLYGAQLLYEALGDGAEQSSALRLSELPRSAANSGCWLSGTQGRARRTGRSFCRAKPSTKGSARRPVHAVHRGLHTACVTPTPLVFDRVVVDAVSRSESLPDGAAFSVLARNVGDGRKQSQIVRVEATGTAMACLAASGRSVERWIAGNVERRANAHENDGHKLRVLAQEGFLRFDSRYVLD